MEQGYNEAKKQSLSEEFDAAKAMVKVGQVQLNKVSQYLRDLPDSAVADLLVAPTDVARIFGRKMGTFNQDISDSRKIDESHKIHYKEGILTGMQVFDFGEEREEGEINSEKSYLQAWSDEVRSAWQQANESKQEVTTGLATGSRELYDGRAADRQEIKVANNLLANVDQVNAALSAQGASEIVTHNGRGFSHRLHTATEKPDDHTQVYNLDATKDDNACYDRKSHDHGVTWPVALHISPDLGA